jgi:uncharacterized protein (DUF427 family)
MFRAVWNGAVLAESDQTVEVEGNHYFPPESLDRAYLTGSNVTTTCPWKGQARYYGITVDGKTNPDAAWYYPAPSPAARQIKDHVAFCRGVRIERTTDGQDDSGRSSLALRVRGMLGR